MQKNSQDFSMQEALRLANSDAGQQLLARIQSTDADTLNLAMAQASRGDYEQVKKTLSELLRSAEVQALLKKMEE